MTRTAGHLVYDTDCGFCSRSARRLDPAPIGWHTLDLDAVGATQDEADHNAGFLTPDGRIGALGAPAVAATLRAHGRWTRPLGVLIDLPVIRILAAVVYRLIARNRHRMPGSTQACSFDSRR